MPWRFDLLPGLIYLDKSSGGGSGGTCANSPQLLCLGGRTGSSNNPLLSLDADGQLIGSAASGQNLFVDAARPWPILFADDASGADGGNLILRAVTGQEVDGDRGHGGAGGQIQMLAGSGGAAVGANPNPSQRPGGLVTIQAGSGASTDTDPTVVGDGGSVFIGGGHRGATTADDGYVEISGQEIHILPIDKNAFPLLQLIPRDNSSSFGKMTAFTLQTQAADILYTLPAAAPTVNGQVLSADTSGVMSWASGSGADCTTAPTLLCLGGRAGTTNNPTISSDADGTVRGSGVANGLLELVSDTGAVQTRLRRTIFGTDALILGPGDDPLIPFLGGPVLNFLVTEESGLGAVFGALTASSTSAGTTSQFTGGRSRGTLAAPLPTVAADVFFILSGTGYGPDNNPSFSSGPLLKFEQDIGATAPDSLPTRILLETNAAGASHTLPHLGVRADGRVQVGPDVQSGAFDPPTAQFAVLGDIAAGTTFTEFLVSAAGALSAKASGVFGAAAAPANTNVGLEVQSTTRALLVSRMTTTQKNALTPVNGMIVYDSTLDKFQGYEAGAWVNFV